MFPDGNVRGYQTVFEYSWHVSRYLLGPYSFNKLRIIMSSLTLPPTHLRCMKPRVRFYHGSECFSFSEIWQLHHDRGQFESLAHLATTHFSTTSYFSFFLTNVNIGINNYFAHHWTHSIPQKVNDFNIIRSVFFFSF